MTEPTRPRTTATVRPSGDHAPDPQSADLSTPPAPRISDTENARRRKPLRAVGAVYQQIAADLRAQIEAGDLAPGQAIPSEAQMMQHYGVSRPTVRNAIAALRTTGLLVVQRGRATTVRATLSGPEAQLVFNPAITGPTGKGSTFVTWDSHGWDDVEEPSRYRTEVGQLAQALELAPGEPVFVVDRQLSHTDTGTEITHRIYVPFATAADIPTLTEDPFRPAAELYQALTDAGHDLYWTDTTTTAMPSPDEAATLDIPDGIPLLIHTRTSCNEYDAPLLLEETRLPGHRTVMSTTIPSK